MPGKHDPNKKYISFSIKRTLWYKLTQHAHSLGIDRSSYVVSMFENEMNRLGVELTPENKAKAEAETKAVIEERRRTWSSVH